MSACWRDRLCASAELMSCACWQVDLSERYSAASESGSSTDGHPETVETKDGKNSPWERRESMALTLCAPGFCSYCSLLLPPHTDPMWGKNCELGFIAFFCIVK